MAIVLSSIAIIARNRSLLGTGGVLGVVGLVAMLNGFFLWTHWSF